MIKQCLLLFLLLLFIRSAKAIDKKDSIPYTKIIVYTTADSSNLRLTLTDTLGFHFFGQPLESEPCIFVDPSKTFQTFVGIGGALTPGAKFQQWSPRSPPPSRCTGKVWPTRWFTVQLFSPALTP